MDSTTVSLFAEHGMRTARERSDHTAFVDGDFLYVWGGYYLFCVNLLDGMFTWRRVTDSKGSPPSPRDKHSSWVHADRIIYFGGYGCKQMREVNDSRSFITDEISWGDPPKARAAHSTATLGKMGYLCGGMEAISMDIHCLDLESWTWTKIVPTSTVPMERSWHTLTSLWDSTLFLFGGLSAVGEPLSDAWIFDIRTKEWTELQHPHRDKPRLWHSACQGPDSDVIVFGGSRDYTLIMDSVCAITTSYYSALLMSHGYESVVHTLIFTMQGESC
ncbi:hypothetical protein JZ751_026434 [Albula glossodonta]|uniref:Kelch domain-containing protein 1 n=1 Tax=Albula glossodonta TaxID=121402 RepID=A0A8T2PFY9_9TELE|nr:hypothetical protein JZ751_026434 [Albula glossodonta]